MSLLQPVVDTDESAGKVALFGSGGSGKSITAALLAVALSKERCESRAVAFVDPEHVKEFVAPIFKAEGVPLFVVPTRTFVEMRDALKEAEDADCCVFIVDHYDGIFRELTEAQKEKCNLQGKRLPYQHREELMRIWDGWVRRFRASALHTIFNGRLAWDWGDAEDDDGDPVKVKLGTKMRGDADAGYEPNLMIELERIDHFTREKISKKKQGEIEHVARIVKDRRMVLNGRSFAWKDLNGYQEGDYQKVWKDLAPHFRGTGTLSHQRKSQSVIRTSAELFNSPAGESVYAADQRRRDIATEELQASLAMIWPGQTGEEKRLKTIVLESLFSMRSWTAIEHLMPELLESAVTVLHHFEQIAKSDKHFSVRDEASVIAVIQACKDKLRHGEAEKLAEAVI